jgi:hypothetical protein
MFLTYRNHLTFASFATDPALIDHHHYTTGIGPDNIGAVAEVSVMKTESPITRISQKDGNGSELVGVK